MFESNESRRDFLIKTAYVTPLILTMNVSLAQAQVGSAAPVDRLEDFSGGGADAAPVGSSVAADSSGENEGKEHHDNGKHLGWYKDKD